MSGGPADDSADRRRALSSWIATRGPVRSPQGALDHTPRLSWTWERVVVRGAWRPRAAGADVVRALLPDFWLVRVRSHELEGVRASLEQLGYVVEDDVRHALL